MADELNPDPAGPNTNQGAGTTAPPAPVAPAAKPAPPAGPKAAPAASHDTKDARIAALEAQLAASEAKSTLAQIQQAQQPTPSASFAAPSAPLVGKHDSLTGLVQQLPQKLWDQLSDEDQARFTDAPEQPEKPADLK